MKRSHRFARLVGIVLTGGVVLGVCLVALGPGVTTLAASSRYSGKVAPQLKPLDFPTTLYAADGQVMDRLGNVYRSAANLDDVPKVLQDAVIATEDRSFYSNPGIDMRAIVRAFGSNVDSGGIGQGGSTITQQLIKNRYFTNPKRDLDRKVREAVLATRLTNEWSKHRILQEYLNTVYFGVNAYGVSEAATRIAGKPLAKIDLADAALLAGLIKNPSAYDPFVHPDAAKARRAVVLDGMVASKKITQAQATFAAALPLPTRQDCRSVPGADPTCDLLQAHSPYAEEVKNRMLGLSELGADEQERAQRIFAGGLKVYTAYRRDVTDLANNAIATTIGRYEPTYGAGMAVIDPHNGEVLAIASSGATALGFNLATMGPSTRGGRFVGSTFKPITLATAITKGYSPLDTVSGVQDSTDPVKGGSACKIEYKPWNTQPYYLKNAGDSSVGGASLYDQTKHSVNCAYGRLFTSVGPPEVQAMAKRLGYTRPVNPYLSAAIGDTAHSPLEVATVFSTFASEGMHHDPVFIRRIEDSAGHVIYRAPGGNRALSVQNARTVTDVLSHVTDDGATGTRAKLPDDRPLAGKTGTRDQETDAWFAGYTPQMVAAVWMGNPTYSSPEPCSDVTGRCAHPEASMNNVGGVKVYGCTYPAQIWRTFMAAALAKLPIVQFTKPDATQWPSPSPVNPAGGRGQPLGYVPSIDSGSSSTTSSTLPVDSTTTTLPPETTTSSTSSPPTTTTSKPKGP
jgi:membrane peptidoglycan carboxypeptidase